MIILDTETTGLLLPNLVPVGQQPQLIEFTGIKLDDFTLEETERLWFLCKPDYPLTEEIIKITKITDEMLKDEKQFSDYFNDLANFFLGEFTFIAHNLEFDKTILRHELERIGKEFSFPWPPNQVCTVEKSFCIENRKLKLSELHLQATGKDFKDAHRSTADTEALARCVRWMREEGLL